MLQRADITGARPVILVEAAEPAAALGDAKQEALARLSQLALGKEFQAQVLSRLADGSYLVQIDDAVAGMKLPPGTQTGDILDLTLLATEPRATFLLGKPSDTSTTSLSPAGRLLTNLLQLAQEDGAPPAALVGKTPLLAHPDTPAAQIATALRQAINFSGLFYESHVAQWANGTRPMVELLNEPPVKLLNSPPAQSPMPAPGTPLPPPSPHLATQTAELDQLLNSVKQWAEGKQALANAGQEHKLNLANTDSDSMSPIRQDATLTTEGAKLLSLQLDALEQRRVVWHGELFPGQPFEWEISDDTPHRGQETVQDDEARTWQSTVRFSLPVLGTVSATVKLTGEHVRVQVQTSNEGSAATLRSHGGLLAQALEAAGSKLDTLQVSHDG